MPLRIESNPKTFQPEIRTKFPISSRTYYSKLDQLVIKFC